MTESTDTTRELERGGLAARVTAIPAWLNLDEIMPPATRAEIRDVIAEGIALAPMLAAWAERGRQFVEYELPNGLYENLDVARCTGIETLDHVFYLLGLLTQHPAGNIGPVGYDVALEVFPEYADLIESSASGRSFRFAQERAR